MNSKGRVLFVTHDATRTGAPIVLLHLLKWIKNSGSFPFSVFVKDNLGDLVEEFKKVGTTYLPYEPPSPTIYKRVLNKILSKLNLKRHSNQGFSLPPAMLAAEFSLIYLNTIASIDLAPLLKSTFNCPVIAHIHENEFTIKNYYSSYVSNENMNSIDHFIAVSDSTKDNLIKNYNLDGNKISVINAFIEMSDTQLPTVSKEEIKEKLGLKDEFIIGAAGLTSWRKGVDLFIQLAVLLRKSYPDHKLKFIWVGSKSNEFECQFLYEKERLQLDDAVLFTGKKDDPHNYFQLFDVFVLTSREDPFPLVVLEAASLEIPVICFRSAGGIPEILSANTGGIRTVNYSDINEMATQVLILKENQNLRKAEGKLAKARVEDFKVDVSGRKIIDTINIFLENA